jgi:[acyl-carrier-protein] S-malonyltransferase
MDVVLLFPGQGSQKPGMGKDLADRFPEARAVFDTADRVLGTSLSQLCFEGPAEELMLTHNAQPALVAHGAAVWAVVREKVKPWTVAAAGHSLGEFTAHHAAGAISLEDALRLVRRRGELMYETGVKRPGTMAAILGETDRPIEAICDDATREAGTVVVANYNCPGQLVISGESAGVERAMELCKASGAKRAVKLNVSGAFHSPLMQPAQDGLRQALDTVEFKGSDTGIVVFANVDAGWDMKDPRTKLVEQLVSPVRWTEEITAMALWHPGALFVEMGPGSVLTGLVKKIAPTVKTMTCGTVPEVDRLLELVATENGAPAASA